METKIFKLLLLVSLFSFSYIAKAKTTIIINNNTSSCDVVLDMWHSPQPFPSVPHLFCGGLITAGSSVTYSCLEDITHVEFNYISSNGFNVSTGSSPGSGTFSGTGCLNGVSYTWTYTTLSSTCSGLPANTLTININ
jgi:hypothetical protein